MDDITALQAALTNERQARRRAEEACVMRSRFLASLGHTLRSPLNGILGFAQVLLEEQCGPLTDRQRMFVERLLASGERELELVNNLIELARMHAGEAVRELRPVTVARLVTDVVREFSSQARTHGVALTVDAAEVGQVHGNEEQLRQAVANLVSNAVRVASDGGEVQVRVSQRATGPSADDDGPRFVRIEVSDTGPGIPAAEQSHLFDDFVSAEALDAGSPRRSGVGLPLVRRIAESHGGRVSVSSTGIAGEGSRFVCELPVSHPVRSVA